MSYLQTLQSEVAQILSAEHVDPDTPVAQLGIDSLNVVELILVCQQIYTGVVNYEDVQFDEHTTLREMDEMLLEFSV